MPQHCPYAPSPRQYGSAAQSATPLDKSDDLSTEEIKHLQHIIGSILYYARAVNMTVLMALSTIANKQAKDTRNTMSQAHQLLDYLATHPNAKVCFHASYLSKLNARSHPSGHFPWDLCQSITGTFSPLCKIPKNNSALSFSPAKKG